MKRLLYLIPIFLYLGFYTIAHNVLENQIPPPVNATLPARHYVEPELKSLVDKYEMYGVDVRFKDFPGDQWGEYQLGTIYVEDADPRKLAHEYIHHKQLKSPPLDWKPYYDSNYQFRQRMLGFYPTYSDIETEAVACTEVSQLPEPYLTRCNSLIVNRSQLPFRL